jgi:dTDP-4-dehydrorhamnose 3,5-epimerase-like enzyme
MHSGRNNYIIEPQVFGDARGWFMEAYNEMKTPQIVCDYVQDNHSFSAQKGTIRGIHFQTPPMEQAKLLRCIAVQSWILPLIYALTVICIRSG